MHPEFRVVMGDEGSALDLMEDSDSGTCQPSVTPTAGQALSLALYRN